MYWKITIVLSKCNLYVITYSHAQQAVIETVKTTILAIFVLKRY